MTRDEIIERLEEARARTLALIAPLSDEDLHRQHDPLMSPIIWDLGHIAHFEELWLVHNLTGPVQFGEMPGIYNPFEHPRRVRGQLTLPSIDECRAIMADIRSRVVDRLQDFEPNQSNPLLRDGYVYAMVLQHEYQHNETILQTLQLKQGEPYRASRAIVPPNGSANAQGGMVRFPGGIVRLGTEDRTFAYDNERPVYEMLMPPFLIDEFPVSNGDFLEFMREGGYQRDDFWSEAGRAWRAESKADAPKYWLRDGASWCVRIMNDVRDVDPDLPVCHVCYHEAEAFARYAGKRLPTEQEWETAAGWDATVGRTRRFPWGDEPATSDVANIDQLSFTTARAGAYDRNWSPLGCYGMIGDVWEWTSSDFSAYPGYEMFPYSEYSEVFFGTEYKVLRGGSWATRPGAIRNSFRNWDYPIRRQIFSGFRCAQDD